MEAGTACLGGVETLPGAGAEGIRCGSGPDVGERGELCLLHEVKAG